MWNKGNYASVCANMYEVVIIWVKTDYYSL